MTKLGEDGDGDADLEGLLAGLNKVTLILTLTLTLSLTLTLTLTLTSTRATRRGRTAPRRPTSTGRTSSIP